MGDFTRSLGETGKSEPILHKANVIKVRKSITENHVLETVASLLVSASVSLSV